MTTKYVVKLTEEERQELMAFVSKGQKNAYKIRSVRPELHVFDDPGVDIAVPGPFQPFTVMRAQLIMRHSVDERRRHGFHN